MCCTYFKAIGHSLKKFPPLRKLFAPPGVQARRQDVAKNEEGPKTRRGGHIFEIQYWMYAATGGPNVKWGAPISNEGRGTTGPSAGDSPAGVPSWLRA